MRACKFGLFGRNTINFIGPNPDLKPVTSEALAILKPSS